MITPKKIITAPAGVTRVETPSQKTTPKFPDFPIPATDKKISIEPTITLGCDKGNLILLIINAKDKNIKGKNKVAHPNMAIMKSLNLTRIIPFLEKEIIISPASPKKTTWAMDAYV